MKTDKEIIELMNNEDRIRELREEYRQELLRDNKHELDMRNDIDYFLENSSFEEFNEAYNKFTKELQYYGWEDKPEEFVV